MPILLSFCLFHKAGGFSLLRNNYMFIGVWFGLVLCLREFVGWCFGFLGCYFALVSRLCVDFGV